MKKNRIIIVSILSVILLAVTTIGAVVLDRMADAKAVSSNSTALHTKVAENKNEKDDTTISADNKDTKIAKDMYARDIFRETAENAKQKDATQKATRKNALLKKAREKKAAEQKAAQDAATQAAIEKQNQDALAKAAVEQAVESETPPLQEEPTAHAQESTGEAYAKSGIPVYINSDYAPDLSLSGDLYNYGWDIIRHLNSGTEFYNPSWGKSFSKSSMQHISETIYSNGFAHIVYSYVDYGTDTISDIKIHNLESSTYAIASNYDRVVAELRSIVNSSVYNGMDQTDALLALNNEIANRVTFDISNADYSRALINGYYGNCTVYADLYHLACKMIGVQATVISGYANGSSGYVAHAWNYVPGYGYIDVTYNDATGNAYLFSQILWSDHGDIFSEKA